MPLNNQEKNNNFLKLIIVVLIILILGLSTYILYDKVLKDDKTENNQPGEYHGVTSTTLTSTELESLINKLNGYWVSCTISEYDTYNLCYGPVMTIENNTLHFGQLHTGGGRIDTINSIEQNKENIYEIKYTSIINEEEKTTSTIIDITEIENKKIKRLGNNEITFEYAGTTDEDFVNYVNTKENNSLNEKQKINSTTLTSTELESLLNKLNGYWINCVLSDENSKFCTGSVINIRDNTISSSKLHSSQTAEKEITSIEKIENNNYEIKYTLKECKDESICEMITEKTDFSLTLDISNIDNKKIEIVEERNLTEALNIISEKTDSKWKIFEYAGTTVEDYNNYLNTKETN